MAKYCRIRYQDGNESIVEIKDDKISKAYAAYLTGKGKPGGKFKVYDPDGDRSGEWLIDFRKVIDIHVYTG